MLKNQQRAKIFVIVISIMAVGWQQSLQCKFGQYRISNSECGECLSSCSKCQDVVSSCPGCAEGYRLNSVSRECMACNRGQLACAFGSITCQPHYQYNSGKCAPICQVGNCKECQSIYTNVCWSCNSGYSLNGNKTICAINASNNSTGNNSTKNGRNLQTMQISELPLLNASDLIAGIEKELKVNITSPNLAPINLAPIPIPGFIAHTNTTNPLNNNNIINNTTNNTTNNTNTNIDSNINTNNNNNNNNNNNGNRGTSAVSDTDTLSLNTNVNTNANPTINTNTINTNTINTNGNTNSNNNNNVNNNNNMNGFSTFGVSPSFGTSQFTQSPSSFSTHQFASFETIPSATPFQAFNNTNTNTNNNNNIGNTNNNAQFNSLPVVVSPSIDVSNINNTANVTQTTNNNNNNNNITPVNNNTNNNEIANTIVSLPTDTNTNTNTTNNINNNINTNNNINNNTNTMNDSKTKVDIVTTPISISTPATPILLPSAITNTTPILLPSTTIPIIIPTTTTTDTTTTTTNTTNTTTNNNNINGTNNNINSNTNTNFDNTNTNINTNILPIFTQLVSCPVGSLLLLGSCAKCNAKCATCINTPDQCLQCALGWVKNGWKCVTNQSVIYNLTLAANNTAGLDTLNFNTNMGGYLNQFKTAMLAHVLPAYYSNANNQIFTVDSLHYNSADKTVNISGLIDRVGTASVAEVRKTINNTLSKLPVVGPFLVKAFKLQTYPHHLTNTDTYVAPPQNPASDRPYLAAILIPSIVGGLLLLSLLSCLLCYCCKWCCFKKEVGVPTTGAAGTEMHAYPYAAPGSTERMFIQNNRASQAPYNNPKQLAAYSPNSGSTIKSGLNFGDDNKVTVIEYEVDSEGQGSGVKKVYQSKLEDELTDKQQSSKGSGFYKVSPQKSRENYY